MSDQELSAQIEDLLESAPVDLATESTNNCYDIDLRALDEAIDSITEEFALGLVTDDTTADETEDAEQYLGEFLKPMMGLVRLHHSHPEHLDRLARLFKSSGTQVAWDDFLFYGQEYPHAYDMLRAVAKPHCIAVRGTVARILLKPPRKPEMAYMQLKTCKAGGRQVGAVLASTTLGAFAKWRKDDEVIAIGRWIAESTPGQELHMIVASAHQLRRIRDENRILELEHVPFSDDDQEHRRTNDYGLEM